MINRPITSLLGSAVPMAQEQFGYTPTQMMAGSAVPSAQQQLGYTRQPPMVNVPVPQIQTPAGLSSLLAPAPQQKTSMLSGLLSGPGSSARYGALAKALTQNSATPMSLGQRITGGLLAGSDAAKAQEEAAFKRGLLEREMALEAEKVRLKELEITGNKAGDIFDVIDVNTGDIVGQVISGTPEYLSEIQNPNRRLSKIGTTSSKNTDLKGYDVYELQDNGEVKIIGTFSREEASPYFNRAGYRVTDMGAGLRGGVSDSLSQRSLEERMRSNIVAETLAERKFELEYTEAQQTFKDNQKLEERQKEAFFQSTFDIANQVDNIIGKAERFGISNVFGPTSVVSDIPIFGASSAQGEVRAQIEELQSKLVKQALDDFRALSKQGATGFGSLSEKELDVVMKKFINLNLQRQPQAILKDLKDLSNEMKSIAYGVIVDGKFEPYKPSKHSSLISSGQAIPAIPENKKFVGAPKGPEGTVFDTFLNGNPVFIDPKTNKRFTLTGGN